MPDGATILLDSDAARETARGFIAVVPEGWLCRLGPPPRTLDQNKKFWALCTDLSKSDLTWAAKRKGKVDWHTLLLSGYDVIQGHPPDLVIGLEGEMVSLTKHSSDLDVKDMSVLLDYSLAWATMHGIKVRHE